VFLIPLFLQQFEGKSALDTGLILMGQALSQSSVARALVGCTTALARAW